MPYQRIDAAGQDRRAGRARQTIQTPDKANAVYLAGLMLPLTDADPDYAGPGGRQLPARRRHAVVAAGQPRPRRRRACPTASARSSAPTPRTSPAAFMHLRHLQPGEHRQGGQGRSLEELDKLLKDGVDAETELDEAKKAYLEQLKVQRTSDGQLAAAAAATACSPGRTFAYYADLEKKVAA